MEQHPIPQNISSYEFRLVGDMTLKQFLQLAGGIAVAVVIYRLPLVGIIRYPLVFLSVVFGIALAFVPINGRPFARYIFAFISAIYSPTEFLWRQTTNSSPPASAPTTPVPVEPVVSATTEPAPEIPVQTPPPPPETPPSLSATQTIFTAPSPATQTPPPPPLPVPPAPLAEPISLELPNIPPTPTQPNILAGAVATPDGSALDGVIIEILDTQSGIPARALRTNRTGQFQIATPLSPGTYTVQAEKDGYTFAPQTLQVEDKIISPLAIVSV